jgi:hypothetical protein
MNSESGELRCLGRRARTWASQSRTREAAPFKFPCSVTVTTGPAPAGPGCSAQRQGRSGPRAGALELPLSIKGAPSKARVCRYYSRNLQVTAAAGPAAAASGY